MTRIDLKHSTEVSKEKREVLKIAKQLCYPKEVIAKIENARSIHELDRIMKDARGNR